MTVLPLSSLSSSYVTVNSAGIDSDVKKKLHEFGGHTNGNREMNDTTIALGLHGLDRLHRGQEQLEDLGP